MNYFERIIIWWLSIYSPEGFVFNTPCLGAKRRLSGTISFLLYSTKLPLFSVSWWGTERFAAKVGYTLESKMVSLHIYKKETRKTTEIFLTEEKERCMEKNTYILQKGIGVLFLFCHRLSTYDSYEITIDPKRTEKHFLKLSWCAPWCARWCC